MSIGGGNWMSVSCGDWSVGVSWIRRGDLVGVSVAGRDWVVSDGSGLDDWGSISAMISVVSAIRIGTVGWSHGMCNWGGSDRGVEAGIWVATISISWSGDDCAGSSDEC